MAEHSDATREAAITRIRSGESYRSINADLGVALGTLSKWASEAGIESPRAEQTAAAAEATRVAWHQRRAGLVDRFGDVAELLLGRIETDDTADARNLMTAAGIAVDKAQLLSGGVTSRHEQLDAQRRRERVEALQTEVEQRLRLVSDDDAADGTTGG